MRLSFPHPLYYYWYDDEVGMFKVSGYVTISCTVDGQVVCSHVMHALQSFHP